MPLYQGFGPLYFFSSCQRQENISGLQRGNISCLIFIQKICNTIILPICKRNSQFNRFSANSLYEFCKRSCQLKENVVISLNHFSKRNSQFKKNEQTDIKKANNGSCQFWRDTYYFRETKPYVKKLRITFTHSCSLKHKKQRNIKSLCSRGSKCNRKKSLATFRS